MDYAKTAISIPRDVFEGGEEVAAELGISRSELYTRALRTMLRARKLAAARAQLNEAFAHAAPDADNERQANQFHGAASATIHRAHQRGESTW
jgi:antitoxin MazE6